MKKPRAISLSKKISLAFVLIIAVAMGPHAFHSYQTIQQRVEKKISARLIPIARTAAAMVEPYAHLRLVEAYRRQDSQITESADYKEVQRLLQKIQRANDLTGDLYTVIRPDWKPDTMVFVAMSNIQPYVGNGVPLAPPALAALDRGKTATSSIYEDRGAAWISSFAPILQQGKVIGAVKVDFSVDDELREARSELIEAVGYPLGVAVLLSLLLGGIVGKRVGRTRATEASEAAAHNELQTAKAKLAEQIQSTESLRETLVSETRSAQSILGAALNSVHEGVLLFDREGKLLLPYSRACENWFGGLGETTVIWDLIGMTEDELPNGWRNLFDEPVAFDETVAQLPASLKTDSGARLRFTYSPVRNEEQKVISVILVVSDLTKELEASLSAEKTRAQLKTFTSIVRLRSQVARFIYRTREFFREANDELSTGKEVRNFFLGAGLREIRHQAEIFSLTRLASLAHEYELELAQMQEAPPSILKAFLPRVTDGIQKTREAFEDFLHEYDWLLGEKTIQGERICWVSITDLSVLVEKLAAFPAARSIAGELREQHLAEPLQNYFQHLGPLVSQLAREHEKQIEPIEFVGGSTRVVPEPLIPLFQNLEDAFRNAIHHGIEPPAERVRRGKSPNGRLTVTFGVTEASAQIPAWLTIAVEDDGRGIDPLHVRTLVDDIPGTEKSDHQIIQHVFDDNFTATVESSPFSIGHGLSALRHTVHSLGGLVEIHSHLGQGTILTVMIPIPDSTPAALKSAA